MAGVCGVSESRTNRQEDEHSPPAPNEDPDAARLRQGREAEARKDGLLQCGVTEDERSREQFLRNVREQNAKLAEYTSHVDAKAVKSDPVGNALPIIVVSGAVAGAKAAAVGGLRAAAAAFGAHVAKEAAKEVVKEKVLDGAAKVAEKTTASRSTPAAPPVADAEPATPAGRTSAHATSEASEPSGSCRPEVPAGKDRIPYVPGQAPLHIPEAPREEEIPRPVTIHG